jgi:hypothetical protein
MRRKGKAPQTGEDEMDTQLVMPPEERRQGLLVQAIFGLDLWLRHRQEVFEYTSNSECIFRIQLAVLQEAVALPDGTALAPGERIFELHLWNEHIPVFPPSGASLTWARKLSRRLDVSLYELRRYLARQPEFADIRAIRANMSFGTAEQVAQVARISHRYGFEPVPGPRRLTLAGRLHIFGENILITLRVWAQNAGALRRDSLRRDRSQVFLSRAVLERRYALTAPAEAS